MSDDARTLAEIAAISDLSKPHKITHYVYVPSSDIAGTIAKALERQGLQCNVRLGADGKAWLIQAQHEAIPSEELLSSIRSAMEAMVSDVQGEYDGWDVEIPPKPAN